jgi:hypothetical protein
MGSSEAAGYVNLNGHVMGWLNELAADRLQSDSPVDEWSGDTGCGSIVFLAACVFRLAPRAGIQIPAGLWMPKN